MFEVVRTVERLERPEGSLALRCRERSSGMHFEVVVGGRVAMGAGDGQSERLLARVALERLGDRSGLSVLIGGLGLGLTLREVLAHTGVARVQVAELEPAVVRWNRTLLRALNGDALDSDRVEVTVGDVMSLVDSAVSSYDAILLDVDNGPSMLLHPDNEEIYRAGGLARLRTALRPGGVLGLWCNREESTLHGSLEEVFGEAGVFRFREPGYPAQAPCTAIHFASRD